VFVFTSLMVHDMDNGYIITEDKQSTIFQKLWPQGLGQHN